ncbi:MAG: class I SAM-dependent methyltransferase [Phenylobacterium sp.]
MKTQQAESYYHGEGVGEFYNAHNYGSGLSGWVLRNSHAVLESEFSKDVEFPRVAEVGAGTGVHFGYVRHRFQDYVMTDASAVMLEQAQARSYAVPPGSQLRFELQDATKLTWEDAAFDRLIAAHSLEHIPAPQLVLAEWWRVLKPGGVLSLLLPCDPGVMWRLGRSFGPRQKAEKAGLAYDYSMALEHINAINGLRAIIRYKYADQKKRETWWPFPFASIDLNLIYCVNIRK